YLPDGRLDESFSDDGIATVDFSSNDRASGVAVDDHDIVLGGDAERTDNSDLAVARLDQTGELDSSFSGDGKETLDTGTGEVGRDVAVDENGGIYLVGKTFPDDEFAVARFLHEGGPDDSF